MSYYQHHALVLTGLSDGSIDSPSLDAVEAVRADLTPHAAQFFVGPVVAMNSFVTYALLPDGGSRGRELATEVDMARQELLRVARSNPFIDAVHITFGDEGSEMTSVEYTTDAGVSVRGTHLSTRSLRPGEYARLMNRASDMRDPLLVQDWIAADMWEDVLEFTTLTRALVSSRQPSTAVSTWEDLRKARQEGGIDREIDVRVTPQHIGGGFLVGADDDEGVALLPGEKPHARPHRYGFIVGSSASALREHFQRLWESAEPLEAWAAGDSAEGVTGISLEGFTTRVIQECIDAGVSKRKANRIWKLADILRSGTMTAADGRTLLWVLESLVDHPEALKAVNTYWVGMAVVHIGPTAVNPAS